MYKVPILLYHRIAEDAAPSFRPFTVPPGLFLAHMKYLHAHGYTPLTVSQYSALRTDGSSSLPKRPVVITFDDGFADFYTHALPILRRFAFNATLYVTTASMNGMSRWLRQPGASRPMLTWKQLHACVEQGIECGAHSHTHPQMDLLTRTEAKKEIALCKDMLEEHIAREVTSFAYPYGYHTKSHQHLVRDAGFSSACAVIDAMSSPADDAFALARLYVLDTTDITAFAALLAKEPLSATETVYLHARVPVWRLVRRCSASMSGLIHAN